MKFAALAAALLLLIPLASYALEWRTSDQLSLGASERAQGDLYMAGGNITTAASVAGDLTVAGGNILVNGPVGEDLFATGGSITVLGDIGDDLRAAGGNITVSSNVGGDAVIGGGQVNIAGEGIGGDVLAGAGVLRIDAPVAGDVTVGGGEVYLNSRIGGSVRFTGETLTLGSGAIIEGDLSYTSPKEATLESGAAVRGATNFERAEDVRGIAERGLLAFVTLAFIGKFLSLLACALVVGLAFSKYSVALVEAATARPLFEIGRGLITAILMPVVSVLLLVTILGIPFGLLGFAGFFAALVFASLVAPILLGGVVYRYFAKRNFIEVSWKTILLGVVLYTLIGLVPFLGGIAKLTLLLLTLGAIVKIKIDIARNWQ